MLHKADLGAWFVAATTTAVIKFCSFIFVNDTDLFVATARDNNNTAGERVLAEAQAAAIHWEGGLRASGGALVDSKLFWFMIDYKWNGTKWIYQSKADAQNS